MKTNFLLLILISIFYNATLSAQIFIPQKLYYSQPFATPMLLNPAFTGIQLNPRAGIMYYNRYEGSTFSSFNMIRANLNYDQFVNKIKSGFGLSVNYLSGRDSRAIVKSISGLYSYEAKLNEDFALRAGVNFCWNQNISSKVIPSFTGFSTITNDKITTNYFDVGAGMLVFAKSVYSGISVHNITQPEIKLSQDTYYNKVENRRYNIHGGGFIYNNNDLQKGWMFNPNFMFDKYKNITIYSAGLNISKSFFTTGFRFNNDGRKNSIDLNIGLIIKGFKIGYSTIVWNPYIGSQHEVSLIYQFNKPKDISKNKIANNFRRIF